MNTSPGGLKGSIILRGSGFVVIVVEATPFSLVGDFQPLSRRETVIVSDENVDSEETCG